MKKVRLMNAKTVEGNLNNALKGLNVFQITAINNYISVKTELKISEAVKLLDESANEREESILKSDKEKWLRISKILVAALRKNHISQERIKKIDKDMLELDDLGLESINEKSKDIKVLSTKNFEDLIELAIDTSCRDCQHNHKHCKAFYILKKYNVPKPTGNKLKCKYAYGKAENK